MGMDVFKEIFQTSRPQEIIDFVRYFWYKNGYAIYNGLLIYSQRPGAVMLATANQWRSLYNREIKHGVTPIVIIRPFGPVEFIYDYLDTYGERELFPNRITSAQDVKIQHWWLPELIRALGEKGIYYSEANFGTRQGADICIVEKPIKYKYVTKRGQEKEIITDCCITVNSMSDNESKFLSILHELAHLFCGHLIKGKYTPKELSYPNRAKEQLSANQKEYEAELTANMVWSILGITHDPYYYLEGYYDEDGKVPEINHTEMIKATDKILQILPKSIIDSVATLNLDTQISIF